MATKEQATKTRSSKSKSLKDSSSSRTGAAEEKLKTVVRRLPPNLPEEVFWQSVQPWVTDETVTWKIFYPGKIRKKYNKENISSRAYIAFKQIDQLTAFSQAYDGHLFRDKAGHEAQAVVEYALYQKIPSERKKVDARNATIEQDDDYISFVQSLNAPVSKAPEAETLETLLSSMQPAAEPKSTPLLDALRADKVAAKEKESAIRIQVHQPPRVEVVPSNVPISKKEDPKKKTGIFQHGTSQQMENTQSNVVVAKKGRGKRIEPSKPTKASQNTVVNTFTPDKPTNTSPPKAKPIPTQPKAARGGREVSCSVQTANTVRVSVASAEAINTSDGPKTSSSPAASEANSVPRERRGRPIIGLQTRHFEAALSGAGVSLSPSSNDRQPRRERDKNTDSTLRNESSGAVEASEHRDADRKGRDRHIDRIGGKRRDRGDLGSTSGSLVAPSEGQSTPSASLQPSPEERPQKPLGAPRASKENPPDLVGRPPRRHGRDPDDVEGGRGGHGRRRMRGGPP